ncbi:CMRF35-like molecule 5 isoform X3 [Odocoileus virginianus]|uniref:CMRF35-like molecule 5 isoform X3 n=1 Tax=Odocoileus virginianus TaxID=9874 RepID=A0ABM4J7R6_ODOVR
MHLLLLFCLFLQLSGSSAISGPRAVRGVEQASLTVRCRYDPGYESYLKWWCRGADWGSCRIMVKTTESEKEVKKGRVSIKDDWKDRSLTVTMEKLRLDDSDTYWCGIEKFGTDLGNRVEVTIDPAPTTVPTTTTTTPTTSTVTTKDIVRSSAETGHTSNNSDDGLGLSVLLPLIFAVLLLLFMVASLVAWRMAKRPKKAAGTSPVQVRQPPGSDINYADLNLPQIEKPSGSSRKKPSGRASSSPQAYSGDGDYANTAEVSRDSITYAALSLDTLDEQPTYSNMEHLNGPPPSRILEEATEYSVIRKP